MLECTNVWPQKPCATPQKAPSPHIIYMWVEREILGFRSQNGCRNALLGSHCSDNAVVENDEDSLSHAAQNNINQR